MRILVADIETGANRRGGRREEYLREWHAAGARCCNDLAIDIPAPVYAALYAKWAAIPIPVDGAGPGPAPSNPPGLFQRAVSLARALGEWAAAGLPLAPAEARRHRESICAVCPHSQVGTVWVCGLCTCTRVKLWLATSVCPDTPPRWAAVPAESSSGQAPIPPT